MRHGETTWNAEGRIQGQFDAPLSERGRRQAEQTARALRCREISTVYASDLGRAVDTATPIANGLGAKLIPDARLREQSYGELEGTYWRDVPARWPDVHRALETTYDFDLRLPGGESRADLTRRGEEVMEEIARRHEGETVVVVSHGGLLRYFTRSILSMPERAPVLFRIPNCSMSELWRRKDRWLVSSWGSVQHL